LTKFGVFVELEDSLEGLLHISELTDRKVKNPDEVVAVGDTVEVKILRVDQKERKIGLSLVKARSTEESEESQDEKAPADENTEAPADENTEAPADENTEAPADENTEAPADENTEAPADENTETPDKA